MNAVLKESRKARDAGMARAVAGADAESAGWSATAYYVVRGFLKRHEGTFTTEQVRQFAYAKGLPQPRDERAWGSVLQRVAADKYIRKVGYIQAEGKACHMHPVTLWKAVA